MGLKHYTFVDYATQLYAGFVVMLILCFHNGTVHHWEWVVTANLAVMCAVHGLIRWHGVISAFGDQGLGTRSLGFLRHFYPVLLYVFFFCETGWLNRMFIREYLDPVIIHWEQAWLGCQPSVLFMQMFPQRAVSELFYASYFSYYIMISGIGIALFVRDRMQFFHYVSVVSFVFYVCYAIYIFVPVIGPRVFFHEIAGYELPGVSQALAPVAYYPEGIHDGVFARLVGWLYKVAEAPGAALPSSHVAVALVTVFFSFVYLRRIRYWHLALAILLCASTIYCRHHYVIDVVAGVITAAVLVPLANWLYFRVSKAPVPSALGRLAPAALMSRTGTPS